MKNPLLAFVAVMSVSALCLTAVSGCAPATQNESAERAPVANPQAASASAEESLPDYLTRDIRDDVFYFVLPDRFYNGNPANDNGSQSIAISRGGLDKTSKWAFHGGDMAGLEEKLTYLQNMGVTAIWMTPILRNKAIQADGFAHHGYWIIDFTQIDPHFGSNDDLKSLINAAHARGMKVFFDIITNHTADVIKYEECHNPDGSFKGERKNCEFKPRAQVDAGDRYTPFIPAGEENVKTPAWLNDPKYYNNQGDSFWQGESAIKGDFVGLDDIDTTQPEVVAGFIEIYQNLISEFKPDGFRIDTVKHVDLSFWEAFAPAILEHAQQQGIPNFHIFGEVYSADTLVLSRYTTAGKMPSVLDFGFQQAASEVLFRDKPVEVLATLFDNDDFYNDADSQADLLMNFLGNHDMGRAGFFINQATPDASAEEKLKRFMLAHDLMYLSRGIPVIYYGDEQGFTGDGGDVDAREDMFPSQVPSYNDNTLLGSDSSTAEDNFNPAHPIYQRLQTLAELRKDHDTLRRGISINRHVDIDNQTLAFSRVDVKDATGAPFEYLVAVNAATSERTINLPATAARYSQVAGTGEVSVMAEELQITLPALSFALLRADEPLPTTALGTIAVADIQQHENRHRVMFSGVSNAELPLVKVTAEVVDASGQKQLVSHDWTPPYSAVLSEAQKALAEQRGLRVTLTNLKGESRSQTLKL